MFELELGVATSIEVYIGLGLGVINVESEPYREQYG